MSEIMLPPASPPVPHAPLPALRDEWQVIVDEERSRVVSLRGPVTAGLATVILGIGGFLLWAYVTPVAQASAAPGKVVSESNTQTVTHLEGGTLKQIVVHVGQAVKAGQPLALLDVTRSQSTELQVGQQLFINKVKLARLVAERDESDDFTFKGHAPRGMSKIAAAELVTTEARLFKERRNQYADLAASAQAQVEQLEIYYGSLKAKHEAQTEQLSYMQQDKAMLESLATRKLATTPQLNEKLIQVWEMKSRIADTQAAMGQNRQQLAQARLTLSNLRTEHLRQVSEQLQQVQTDIARGEQDMISASDVVEKAAIRAPHDGVVSNIRLLAPGSAITAGSPIMDVVPANQPLLVEARARAMDIDSIHLGAPAEIHLASFGADEAYPLKGKVDYVAADSVVDEKSGEATYAIRVTINDGEMKRQPNLFMYPGMNAEVYVVNGERTAWTYLTAPLTKSFTRAFREQ